VEEEGIGESPSIRDDSDEPRVTGVKRTGKFCIQFTVLGF
jgi:hypothetical protein